MEKKDEKTKKGVDEVWFWGVEIVHQSTNKSVSGVRNEKFNRRDERVAV